jgi:hypothetical protein
MPKNAGRIKIVKMILRVSLLTGVLIEYGFQNKKMPHKMMHPTEATKPKKEIFINTLPIKQYRNSLVFYKNPPIGCSNLLDIQFHYLICPLA